MSAQILDCKAVAQSIKDECKAAAEELKAKGIVPKLGIVRVGEKGPDLSYEKGATSTMNEAGIEVEVFALPADVSQEDYIKKFREINADPAIHGILAFRPLDNIDENVAIGDNLNPLKDVDACTSANMGKLVINDPTGLYPCTASAIVEVIDYYADQIKETVRKQYVPLPNARPGQEDDVACGLDVCIINNSNVIGKPAAMLLTNRFATVSIVHHLTHEETKKMYTTADVVIAATPFKDTVTADMIKEGAIVIDASVIRDKVFDENGEPVINEKTGKQKTVTIGCCSKDVWDKASWMTPVPGVGSITSALLAKNLIKACKVQNGLL
ncbi:MAG: bifunctional 5,10-methylenetetrahydrofolate dehydrogenase/5,10-methenyltetrahydrofolate cyclohydrolase [Eubacteriaceae bacterium]|nr:bifunctional 5,10-methylenetetrahydrofolate dehydrogenase/5,10-methenyltetrahydrofolate cyclohydrolase [Eubacteriaceae bacterium]MBQ1465088.1 bifunctional 5,10-methylenetetrahydrofolate dehydrogenase/5,10-methenyltetrahydrofolate cyclohydrolase [Eubacteriaceae bacterium]MCR4895135.1 bifunctional 5,10-methylenetetrahydrofolate dehydrogenase/5,10-methenyltetrahydrofolate cyclohydrolase [Eubacteriales bacterium]